MHIAQRNEKCVFQIVSLLGKHRVGIEVVVLHLQITRQQMSNSRIHM